MRHRALKEDEQILYNKGFFLQVALTFESIWMRVGNLAFYALDSFENAFKIFFHVIEVGHVLSEVFTCSF